MFILGNLTGVEQGRASPAPASPFLDHPDRRPVPSGLSTWLLFPLPQNFQILGFPVHFTLQLVFLNMMLTPLSRLIDVLDASVGSPTVLLFFIMKFLTNLLLEHILFKYKMFYTIR